MRIERNTMPADSGPGKKGMNPNGLGLGCFDYLPDIDPQLVALIAVSLASALFDRAKGVFVQLTISAASG